MQFLAGYELWQTIRKRASASRHTTAVVGFLGRHPDELFKWSKSVTVVADLSEEAVARGASSARGALALKGMRHSAVDLYSLPNLHAKVLLFDRCAVVSSANLSLESESKLVEAGVLVTEPRALASIRRFVRQVVDNEALPLDKKRLLELACLEKENNKAARSVGAQRSASFFPDGACVWLSSLNHSFDTTNAEDAAMESWKETRAREYLIDKPESVEWLSDCPILARNGSHGDWLVLLRFPKKAAAIGTLDGPYRLLGSMKIHSRKHGTRQLVATLPRRKRSVRLSLPEYRRLLRWMKIPQADWSKPLTADVDLKLERQRTIAVEKLLLQKKTDRRR